MKTRNLIITLLLMLSSGAMQAKDNIAYQDNQVRFTVITDR